MRLMHVNRYGGGRNNFLYSCFMTCIHGMFCCLTIFGFDYTILLNSAKLCKLDLTHIAK